MVAQEVDDGCVAAGSAGSDEHEAKTQENTHHHLTSRQKNKKKVEQGMRLRCETSCDKWSGDIPQEWTPKGGTE